MLTDSSLLNPLIRKLEGHSPLSDADREAILALPFRTASMEAGSYIVREGDRPQSCCVLLSGFAYRSKSAGESGRQICSIHVRGDFVDLQNSLIAVADHDVQTLTDAGMAFIPRQAILDLAAARPAVAQALWLDTLIDAAIFREWIANVGRRDARTRIAHLLCELAARQREAGLSVQLEFELPMTQHQLADATGLTPVHVNRVLQALGADGLISRDKRRVVVNDWERLCEAGDFDPTYLHQDNRIAA
jgi:CRP-like cAMP-binding protein